MKTRHIASQFLTRTVGHICLRNKKGSIFKVHRMGMLELLALDIFDIFFLDPRRKGRLKCRSSQ